MKALAFFLVIVASSALALAQETENSAQTGHGAIGTKDGESGFGVDAGLAVSGAPASALANVSASYSARPGQRIFATASFGIYSVDAVGVGVGYRYTMFPEKRISFLANISGRFASEYQSPPKSYHDFNYN